MRRAPKIAHNALHPGNNKSLPLALAIFDLSTITAIRHTCLSIFSLRMVTVLVNAKRKCFIQIWLETH